MRPFSNGSQYSDWTAKNCWNCQKGWREGQKEPSKCDIEDELLIAYIGDGQISDEIATRTGFKPLAYTWDCLEREDK